MTLSIQAKPEKGEREGADLNQERRRGLRIRQNRPVKVFEPAGARYFGGQTRNISATGLRVDLPAAATVQPGRMINIHVGLAEGGQPLAHRRQMIPARVVWIERPGDGGSICAGVEFLASIAVHLDAA